MYWAAEKLNIPLENFPEYIEQLKVKKDNLIDQIQQLVRKANFIGKLSYN